MDLGSALFISGVSVFGASMAALLVAVTARSGWGKTRRELQREIEADRVRSLAEPAIKVTPGFEGGIPPVDAGTGKLIHPEKYDLFAHPEKYPRSLRPRKL